MHLTPLVIKYKIVRCCAVSTYSNFSFILFLSRNWRISLQLQKPC